MPTRLPFPVRRVRIVIRGALFSVLLAVPAFGAVDYDAICVDEYANVHCTFTTSVEGVKLFDLENAVRQIAEQAPIPQRSVDDDTIVLIEAFGGNGGDGHAKHIIEPICWAGDGAQGGYAIFATTLGELKANSTDLYLYVGAKGPGEVNDYGGSGGAGTLVLDKALVDPDSFYFPGLDNMGVLLNAGGGGGGGGCAKTADSAGDGGAGAIAKSTLGLAASTAGQHGGGLALISGTNDFGGFGEGGNSGGHGERGSLQARCNAEGYDICAQGCPEWGGYAAQYEFGAAFDLFSRSVPMPTNGAALWLGADLGFDWPYGDGGGGWWLLGGGGGGGYGGGGGGGGWSTRLDAPCFLVDDSCSPGVAVGGGGGGGGSWAKASTVSIDFFGDGREVANSRVGGNGMVLITFLTNPDYDADMEVSLTADKSAIPIAGDVTYTLTAQNNGPQEVPSVLLNGIFDHAQKCDWTSVAAGGASANQPTGSGDVVDEVDFPVGGSVTYTILCSFEAVPPQQQQVKVEAHVYTTLYDQNGDNNSATVLNTILRDVNLSMDPPFTEISAVPGEGTVSFSVMVSSEGPDTDGVVPFSAPLSEYLDCTWTATGSGATINGQGAAQGSGPIEDAVLGLGPLTSVQFDFTCAVDDSAPGDSLDVTANISPLSTDPTPDDHTSTYRLHFARQADLVVTMEDGVDAVEPGGTVDYTIKILNQGPSGTTVSLLDGFPLFADCDFTSEGTGGATGFSDGVVELQQNPTLPAGASVTYHASCDVDDLASGTLENELDVGADGYDGQGVFTDVNDVVATLADLSVQVTGFPDVRLLTGELLSLQVVFANGGPQASSGSTLSTSFPGMTCDWTATGLGGATPPAASGTGDLSTSANLAAGSSLTYAFSCTVDTDQPTSQVDVTASVSGPLRDPAPSNDSFLKTLTLQDIAVDLQLVNPIISPDPVVPGGPVTIRFEAAGTGDYTTISPHVVAQVPESLKDCSWTAEPGPGGVQAASGSGAVDHTFTATENPFFLLVFVQTCTLDPAASGSLTYAASITAPPYTVDPPDNNQVSATVPIEPVSDLAVTLLAKESRVKVGDTARYTLEVSNLGKATDPAAAVTLSPPADLACSWTSQPAGGASGNGVGSGNLADTLDLPPGSSVKYFLSCPVAEDAAAGALTTTASVVSSIADSSSGNNAASAEIEVLPPHADLSITKGDGVSRAEAGQSVTYTLVATNAGPDPDFAVTVTDNPPASLTCSWTSAANGGATGNTSGSGDLSDTLVMPVGASVTYTMVCAIDGAATGALANTATITGSGTDPNGTDNTATDDDTVLAPVAALSITKTDGLTAADAGDPLTYTLVATNAGPEADTATIVDTLPAELTVCSWSANFAGGASGIGAGAGDLNETVTMPAGSSATYTVSCTVDPAAEGVLENTATISGTVGDDNPADNTATDDDTVIGGESDLSITKTVVGPPAVPGEGIPAVPGGTLEYRVVAANAGPDPAFGVLVTDTLPSELTCTWTALPNGGAEGATRGSGDLAESVNLPAGASMTYLVVCSVDATATGTITNTATIAGAADDPDPSNNGSSVDTAVPTADLALDKSAPATAMPGESVEYTLVVSNGGPDRDRAARVVDTPPGAGLCSWTATLAGGAYGATSGHGGLDETVNLPAGGGITYLLSCPVGPSATGTLVNAASVTASAVDPQSANDADQVTETLVPTADVSITKTDHLQDASPGGNVTYTLTATNAGPSDDPAVRIQDPLHPDLTCTWVGHSTGGATGNGSGVGPLDEVVSMPAGSSFHYQIACTIADAADGTLINTATVSSSVSDPNPANDVATDDDTVLSPIANLVITKDDGLTEVDAGSRVHYTVVVSNDGPDDEPAAVVTDLLNGAVGCTWESMSTGGATGSAGYGSGDLTESLSLPAGATVTYVLTCDVDPYASGILSNTASVRGSRPDPDLSNNSAGDRDTELLRSPVVIPVDQPLALVLLALALVGLAWRGLAAGG